MRINPPRIGLGGKIRRRKMVIDLSLHNEALYKGCLVEEIAGRLNLKTPIKEAVTLIGRNIAAIIQAIPPESRDSVTLTGPMAVWSYLVVFHAVVHVFAEVRYFDGRNTVVLARHG